MTKRWIASMVLIGGLMVVPVQSWAQQGQGMGMGMGMGVRGWGDCGGCQALASLPKQDLSSAEVAGLSYMREEEKLARDVYTKLYERWGSRVFGNIAQSEQRHYDALKTLLDRYLLPDPAENRDAGVFSDHALQTLYGDLVAQAETSLAAALRVGATIEDLDIRDLDRALAETDNDDLKLVYENLRRGSGNHMRAFVGQLQSLGETYAAQYIGAEALAAILSGQGGRGMGSGRGRGGMGVGRGNGACLYGQPAGSNPGAGTKGPR